MASTYSDLKIELIGTGDQSGTWGITTNSNLGNDGLGAAIAGSADVTFASADVTVTLTDTVAAQTARNLRLNLTGTTGGARNLILGSGCQIEKPYLINNGTADTITVKNTTGTGIAVPAGKSMWVYNNGTNVVDAVTHLTSLTLGSALPIASGGTGSTSTTFVNLATNVTGTLPVGNGGTGATTLTANNVIIGNGTSAVNFVAPGSTGNVLTSNGTTWTSAAGASGTVTSVSGTGSVQGLTLSGTVTSSGSLTLGGSLSAVSLTSQVSGTLPIANGGTGTTSTTFANLTTNVTGTLPVGNGGTGVTSSTGSGSVVLSTSPSLTTPVLGTPTSGTLSNCTVDGTDAVGFRNIPQNVQTGSYTLVAADSGKHIYRGSGSAATWTIPANSSVAYAIGTALTFINLSATSVSIAITSDTMYLSSAGTTGTRTLAQYGSATAIKIASTTWIISGSGLT